MLSGISDLFENQKIYGWAFNSDDPDEHLKINVKVGDNVVAEGLANVFRKDLPGAGVGDGHHAFVITLPSQVTSLRGLSIVAQSASSGNLVLPIETEEDRRINRAISEWSGRYDAILRQLQLSLRTLEARGEGSQGELARSLGELSARVDDWEHRMEATEIFLMRIDNMLTSITAELGKKKKRFWGIF
jgi:hypothetical protein